MSGRVCWDVTLSQVLGCSESDLGLRSSFGSIVSRLEGASGGATVESTWPSHDRSAVARIRRVEATLAKCDWRHVRTLRIHYSDGRLPGKVEARLGRLSRVALSMAADDELLAKLIEACQSGTAQVLGKYRDKADLAVTAAHEDYWARRDEQ
jgi:hypothetical protein